MGDRSWIGAGLVVSALLLPGVAAAQGDPEIGPDEVLRQARAEAGNSVFNAVLMGTPGLTLHLGFDLGIGFLDDRVGEAFGPALAQSHVFHRLHVGLSAGRIAALPLAWLGSFSSEDVLSTKHGLVATLVALGVTDLGIGAVDLIGAALIRRDAQALPGGPDADVFTSSGAILGASGAIQLGLGLVELFSAMGVMAEADDQSGTPGDEWPGARISASPFGAGGLLRVDFPGEVRPGVRRAIHSD